MFLEMVVCAVLGVFTLWLYRFNYYYQRLKKIPSPRVWPLIGNALKFGNAKDSIMTLQTLMKECQTKTLRVHLGLRTFIVTQDYKFIEFLLSSNQILSKGIGYNSMKSWLGEGLVTATGQYWRSHRKMITPSFHFQILEMFMETFETNAAILINKFRTHLGETSVNVYPYVTLCTLDIICETAMGVSINAQLQSDSKYVQSVKEIGQIIQTRSFNPLLLNEFIYKRTQLYQDEQKCLKELHGLTDKVLKQKRAAMEQTSDQHWDLNEMGRKKKVPFLDMLLHFTIDGKPLTDKEIRDEVATFLFGGHDTTAAAISFILYNLANNPQSQQKAFEEQVSIYGADKGKSCTYADLQLMKYMDLVIKESLRLYPPAPMYGRCAKEDFTYDGITIPKDMTLLITAYGIHHDPEHFPDPEAFIPERFARDKSNTHKPFAFIPFSAGPRNCIGQKYALMEMKMTVGRILRHFELKPATPHHKIQLAAATILKAENGIKIALAERHY